MQRGSCGILPEKKSWFSYVMNQEKLSAQRVDDFLLFMDLSGIGSRNDLNRQLFNVSQKYRLRGIDVH